MDSANKLVVITGGAGRVGTAMRPFLRPKYRLRLVDVKAPAEAPIEGEEFVQADMSDLAAAEQVMHGASAMVHLSANASTAATWSDVRSTNIESTYNVFEAARRQGATKVVFATTNHVMGFYNLEGAWPIPTDWAIRPDSLYGVSKAFGEALARYFCDAFGMSMHCIRIGWFTTQRPAVRDLLGLWISPRDLAQLVGLCLESPRPFGIYNGTSNNRQQNHWDLQTARDELGYAPQDDVADAIDSATLRNQAYVEPQAGVLGVAAKG
ncbi:MAG: NAD(P)-dependent oxidoreductase [Chloroflexota bacterium]|nr:NAD(P)-dependent oxidoreductase [Chloroflexota bacterium]